MQRASRLKRELQMLSTEPPPGITCWQAEERMDDLRARKYPKQPAAGYHADTGKLDVYHSVKHVHLQNAEVPLKKSDQSITTAALC